MVVLLRRGCAVGVRSGLMSTQSGRELSIHPSLWVEQD